MAAKKLSSFFRKKLSLSSAVYTARLHDVPCRHGSVGEKKENNPGDGKIRLSANRRGDDDFGLSFICFGLIEGYVHLTQQIVQGAFFFRHPHYPETDTDGDTLLAGPFQEFPLQADGDLFRFPDRHIG